MKLFSTEITVPALTNTPIQSNATIQLYDLTGLPNAEVAAAPLVAINSFMAEASGLKLKYIRELAQNFAATTSGCYTINAPAGVVGIVGSKDPKKPVVVVLFSLDAFQSFAVAMHSDIVRSKLLSLWDIIQSQTINKKGVKLKFAAVADVSAYKKQVYVRDGGKQAVVKDTKPTKQLQDTVKELKAMAAPASSTQSPAKKSKQTKKPVAAMTVMAAPLDMEKMPAKKSSLALLQTKPPKKAVKTQMQRLLEKAVKPTQMQRLLDKLTRKLCALSNLNKEMSGLLFEAKNCERMGK